MICSSLSEIIFYISMSIGITTFPMISEKNKIIGSSISVSVIKITFILVIVFSIIFFIIGPSLIKIILGIDYLNAIKPLLILLPGTAAMSVSKVALTSLSALGRPGFQSLGAFIVFVK